MWLEYSRNEKSYKLYLGEIKGEKEENIVVKACAEAMEYLDLEAFEKNSLENFTEKQVEDVTIDIIIPVYNGFQYLDPLLNSIKNTNSYI